MRIFSRPAFRDKERLCFVLSLEIFAISIDKIGQFSGSRAFR